MPRFYFKPCDPDDVEAGAIIYEKDVPILRTFHLPGWGAEDHDDAAECFVTELAYAWYSSQEGGRKIDKFDLQKGEIVKYTVYFEEKE